jgi:hypothetical protein
MGAAPFENPLIGNARLREMYTTMVQARVLQRHLRRQYRGFATGLEACWVATAIDLHEGDLTSDAGVGPLLGFARRPDRLKAKVLASVFEGDAGPGRLATVGKGYERLWSAVGAALALRAAGSQGVVLAYAGQRELEAAEWTKLLRSLRDAEAPLVLVVLPEAGRVVLQESGAEDVAALACKVGVPGIPVDASDAVAIYRVAQESIVRARADGKPALIAGVPFLDAGGKKMVDPVEFLGAQLIARRVATAGWARGVEGKFRGKLNAALGNASK